jgi:hypothetical protein
MPLTPQFYILAVLSCLMFCPVGNGAFVFVEGGVVCIVVAGLQSDGDIAESCVVPPGALGCPSHTTDTTFRGWPQRTSKVRLGYC